MRGIVVGLVLLASGSPTTIVTKLPHSYTLVVVPMPASAASAKDAHSRRLEALAQVLRNRRETGKRH